MKGTQTRELLTDAFFRDLERSWRKDGLRALDRCAEEHPSQYVGIVARLMPKEAEFSVNVSGQVTHEHQVALTSEWIAQTLSKRVASQPAPLLELQPLPDKTPEG